MGDRSGVPERASFPSIAGVGADNLVFDEEGATFELETSDHQIGVVEASGSRSRTFGRLGDGPLEFNRPIDAEHGTNDRVYLLDRGRQQFQILSEEGEFIGSSDKGQRALSYPHDLAIGPDGRIYVSDTHAHEICVFDPNGRFLQSFGGLPTLNGPRGIAVTDSGEIHVVDGGNARVQVFNASGKPLHSYGEYGTANGRFQNPSSIAIDGQGRACISDPSSGFISVFATDGTFLGRIRPRNDRGESAVPMRLRTTATGGLYVWTAGHDAQPGS